MCACRGWFVCDCVVVVCLFLCCLCSWLLMSACSYLIVFVVVGLCGVVG